MQASNRAVEIEDWLNFRIYHPLAWRLARLLVPTGVSPNMVSVTGGTAIVAAAWAYTSLIWPISALLGCILHVSWHVIDGADGDLARMTGRTSAHGEVIDGLCDYVGHIVLYCALAVSLGHWAGPIWAWVLAFAAGGSHIAQNNHYESMRRTYLWWAYGLPWLKTTEGAASDEPVKPTWFTFIFGWMASDYLRLSAAMSPRGDPIDALFADHADNPVLIGRFRQAIRAQGKSLLSFGPYLGANYRTLILAVSMMIGSPLWFFLAEAVGLNMLLVLSARRKTRLDAKLLEELRAIAASA